MTKKKIVLIVIAVLIGSYACFWTAAQIYNYYNPPVAADGALGIQNFYQMQIEEKNIQQEQGHTYIKNDTSKNNDENPPAKMNAHPFDVN